MLIFSKYYVKALISTCVLPSYYCMVLTGAALDSVQLDLAGKHKDLFLCFFSSTPHGTAT